MSLLADYIRCTQALRLLCSVMEYSSDPKYPERQENGDSVDDDDWSRQVQTDASESGALSTSTSLVMDRNGDKNDDDGFHNTTASADTDDDNWSRQVNTDDIAHHAPSSILDEAEHTAAVDASTIPTENINTIAPDDGFAVAPPLRDEPTLKEKLVERERQRRVETERARWKLQFAMRNESHEESLAEDDEGSENAEQDQIMRENGSVAGTVGEGSVVAPVDVLLEDDAHKEMNYPMERFLKDKGTIMEEDRSAESLVSSKRDTQNQGVLMERFLQGPVLVDTASSADQGIENDFRPANVDRSVSFEMDPPHTPPPGSPQLRLPPSSVGGESIPEEVSTPPRRVSQASLDYGFEDRLKVSESTGIDTPAQNSSYLTDALMDGGISTVTRASELERTESAAPDLTIREVLPPSPMVPSENEMTPESPLTDQPRVLGLTQAEIEELAAIDEVSQENAPPSERDDLSASSFVAELVSDFGGPGVDHAGVTSLSQDTPTTAMESASFLSGNQSAQPTVSETADDQRSIDALGTGSVNSNMLAASSAGESASVTANPPSELGQENTHLSPLQDFSTSAEQQPTPGQQVREPVLSLGTSMPTDEPAKEDLSDLATLNASVVNRQIRPGMVNVQNVARRSASPVRRVMSVPDKMDFDLDGFDYDKNAPESPPTDLFSSKREASAHEMWSPGSKFSLERSPFRPRLEDNLQARSASPPNYGATDITTRRSNVIAKHEKPLHERGISESEPFVIPDIPDVPDEIVTNSRAAQLMSVSSMNTNTIRSMMDDVFNDVRGDNTAVVTLQKQDTLKYLRAPLIQRAFPSRFVSLAVTLALEVPILLAISGGSDRLCSLLGRSSYHLLMGLLPMCCAISGNAGLQSSVFTSRAVSTGVVTMKNFNSWLRREIFTTALVGLGAGALIGALTYWFSNWNFWLGVTIWIAQWISILAAGITGSVAPIFCTFFLEQDADKWNNLMITAIQDIVASFSMIVVVSQMLGNIGTGAIDSSDSC